MQDLPPEALKRALVMDLAPDHIDLFLPPLLSVPFEQLIRVCSELLKTVAVNWQGYTPVDTPGTWSHLIFSSDPGVLYVNLPTCSTCEEHKKCIEQLLRIALSICVRT